MQSKILFTFLLSIAFFTSKSQTTFGDSTLQPKPKMQIVFALDATGSMSGLMTAAKDKIWSIINSLNQTDPMPEIQVGFVFYRDKGDAFITKISPLTDKIDDAYADLMQMQAVGGGDGPESVNKGLYDAVNGMKWNNDTSTYKAIFLVGDYEPHMDYKNDVPYYETCKIAKAKDIVLNTILMGNNETARKIWQKIAACNEGAYVNVKMNVNDIAINTPFDDAIAAISDSLDDMKFYYGSTAIKTINYNYSNKGKDNAKLSKTNVKAQRAENNFAYAKKTKAVQKNELLEDLKNDKVSLDSVLARKDELPNEMKNMTDEQRKDFVKAKLASQDSLQKQLQILITKRNEYVETELSKKAETEVKSSFNSVIYEKVKVQTSKKKIVLKGKAKY
jgi:Mg-chelatase subunit ChlD